jgi:propanol-preferring alcohol dehydrogenase
VSEALQALRGPVLILATASGGNAVAEAVRGLRPGGVVIALGGSPEPIDISVSDLLLSNRKIEGALTGNPATGDAALKFSVLTGVAPMIETVPFEQASEAYAKMIAGQARFRMVLTMAASTAA